MRSNRSPCALRLGMLAVACGLGACAGPRGGPPEAPTLKSLAGQRVEVEPDPGIAGSEARTIAAYRDFLQSAPQARQRSEAMRRLGDLEMDAADSLAAGGAGSGVPDYAAAVARYRDYLQAHPQDPGNDLVLYQMARAQEQGGQLEAALSTLDRLVREHPKTSYFDEAHFRRGEMLFATREYVKAEQAYGTVLQGVARNPYQERALYMEGWSRFKQGRLEDALQSFFGVLDLKLAGRDSAAPLDELAGLTRADRELVEDTFRVASLSLANLQGAESIPAYTATAPRRGYEFRVYEQLGELYVKQDRVKDAADAFGAFARRDPLHEQAPLLQARVVDTYQQAGFANQALDAKKDYVTRYGADSALRRANPAGWLAAQPRVKTHLAELARHHHALAQKNKKAADYREAVHWYRLYLASFPQEADAAQNNFLLAELLFEDKRFAEATAEYEKSAYAYPSHGKSADAGYAALLGHAAQEKAASPAERPSLQRGAVDSALRFARGFPADARTPGVLTDAAEKLYALGDAAQAAQVAQQVLSLAPPPAPAQRRIAWTVVAHAAFERAQFEQAERAYGEVIALWPETQGAATEPAKDTVKDKARHELVELVERRAAAIYKQGEQARDAGRAREAVGHFTRIADAAPLSAVRATAQYDAAAALIGLRDWAAAAATLEDFRQRFPRHPLQGEVSGKLAVAYMEQGKWPQAAAEFERLAAQQGDPRLAREALWQSAGLYERADGKTAAGRAAAARAYERYLKQYPQPFDAAVEARYRLALIAQADGNGARELAAMKELMQAERAGGAARTDRTRYLGAMAALALARPAYDEYRKVALVEPLARQLKLKKAKMDEVLKAYAVAADYGVADATTAATYRTAALYQDFGKALMTSQRPRKLSKAELEQYDVLLEEQAFPFEEKAIELHELNARRTAQGVYDEWVKASFDALRELRPVRYGKSERSEEVVDAIR